MEYAFVLARGKSIRPEHLPEKIRAYNLPEEKLFQNTRAGFAKDGIANSIVKVGLSEKEKLLDALQAADGNQTKAAEILGVSRITVWKRIKKHGIKLK